MRTLPTFAGLGVWIVDRLFSTLAKIAPAGPLISAVETAFRTLCNKSDQMY